MEIDKGDAWLICVKENVNSFGLSQEDAQ